jgi:hypothetical protein
MSSILAEAPLVCHPDTPCAALFALGARIALTRDHIWQVDFMAMGRPADLVLPPPAAAMHTEGLWRTTCFELFLARPVGAYVELNLSPSGAFAAWQFDHYRTGMAPLAMPAPGISCQAEGERLVMSARLAEEGLPRDRTGRIGISAVIAERSGALSYWALAHPPGRPDFHHQDCFARALAPVDRT